MRLRATFFILLACCGGWGIGVAAYAGTGVAVTVHQRAGAPVILADDASNSSTYEDWLNDALAKLSGDNANDQNRAANQLTMVVIDPEDREKVLAALAPHLNGDVNDFRLRCVRAYGHWATPRQVPELMKVVATPEHPKQMSGAENCWGAAVASMVNLDPKSCEQAMQSRTGSFLFRVNLTGLLKTMTTDTGPAQPTAFALLSTLDPGNDAIKYTVADALKMLLSDSADKRTQGALALIHAIVSPADRSNILKELEPHLMGDNGQARLPYVAAYAHWADHDHIKQLINAVAFPKAVSGISGQENCWAAATVGMARLDPQAAADALKSRAGSIFYRSQMHQQLEPIAQGNGPHAAVAEWLLYQLESGNNMPPLPSQFNPVSPPTDIKTTHQLSL